MNRKNFLSLVGLSSVPFLTRKAMANPTMQPETFYFKDDGKIPNNKYPLLLYRKGFANTEKKGAASQLIKQFAANNWTNSWDNGVYSFHHYHSTSHEVLGIYAGSALLQLGGEQGEKVKVEAGDIIVIPAGVGHKKLGASNDFGVVGAYPDGREWDLLKGDAGERPKADKNIAALPIPDFDPLLGKAEGLKKIWMNGK
jgi:uncharacterized protein YjlB